MADTLSAFARVLELQRQQILTPRRAERKAVAMTTSLAANFPGFLKFKTASSRFLVGVGKI